MCDRPAEILVSAPSQSCHDMPKFFWQLSTPGNEKFLYLEHVHQMILAPDGIDHDLHDISTFWRAPWRVTAELNEIVQYVQLWLR